MDFTTLQEKLDNPTIHSKHLLNNVVLINNKDRETATFTDPCYLPFYYHLGKICKAKSIVHIDYKLALEDVCFIQGALSESWVGYNPCSDDDHESINLALNNVKRFCKKVKKCVELKDFEESVAKGHDVFIVTHVNHLKVFRNDIWDNLFPEGLLIVDNIYADEDGDGKLTDFAKSVNRIPIFFRTRYGIGIVER